MYTKRYLLIVSARSRQSSQYDSVIRLCLLQYRSHCFVYSYVYNHVLYTFTNLTAFWASQDVPKASFSIKKPQGIT